MKNVKLKMVGLATGVSLLSMQASAAVPEAVSTMFTDFAADAATLLTAGVALFVAIRGGTGIIRVAKKFIGVAGA